MTHTNDKHIEKLAAIYEKYHLRKNEMWAALDNGRARWAIERVWNGIEKEVGAQIMYEIIDPAARQKLR